MIPQTRKSLHRGLEFALLTALIVILSAARPAANRAASSASHTQQEAMR